MTYCGWILANEEILIDGTPANRWQFHQCAVYCKRPIFVLLVVLPAVNHCSSELVLWLPNDVWLTWLNKTKITLFVAITTGTSWIKQPKNISTFNLSNISTNCVIVSLRVVLKRRKELLLVTDVSTTWAEVIFRVKWIVFFSRWCYKGLVS